MKTISPPSGQGLPEGLGFFLRASLGVPPFGRVPGLPDRRLPGTAPAMRARRGGRVALAQPRRAGLPAREKPTSSVASVPLWLT
jgi:hypothetical protein